MLVANSEKTAIRRKGASAPLRWLLKKGYLQNHQSVLDFGCGYSSDVEHLTNLSFDCYGYDPHFQPIKPTGIFDVVLCTYVLNCVPGYFDRAEILRQAITYIKPGGILYVTIRADKKNLKGYTSWGTWQGYVGHHLEQWELTLLKTGDYETWSYKPLW